MPDLSVNHAHVRPMEVIEARMIPMVADEAITRGTVLHRKANGRAAAADGTRNVIGVATNDAQPGRGVEALYHGRMVGYDLAELEPGAVVYLGAAAGALADTGTVPLGTVHVMTDVHSTRFVFFDISQAGNVTAAGGA